MSKVTLNVATESRDFPAGTVAGQIRFAILSPGGVGELQRVEVDGTSAVFDGIDAGTYTATAQRLDGNGDLLGDAVSTSFVVPGADDADATQPAAGDGAASIDVPSSLTATVE